jgi:aerobic-type carbon monoxide dehydrogenase small subunit (CoxS/CutS family)
MLVNFVLNGNPVSPDIEARTLLSDLLLDHFHLRSIHVGCEHGVCGACAVLVDGRAARSCILLACQADGRSITTVEGLLDRPYWSDLARTFVRCHAMQCGYCTPGMVIAFADSIENRQPGKPAEALRAIEGHLCRCTGYQGLRAVAQWVDDWTPKP